MNITPEYIGVLKGTTVTAMSFSVGIAIGLLFLCRKHEKELDKLAKDTAITCLDFATEHYERAFQWKNKTNEVKTLDNKRIREAMKRYLPVIHNGIQYDCIVEYTVKHDTGYAEVILRKDQMLVRVSADEITVVEPTYADNDRLNDARSVDSCNHENL